MKKGFCNLGEFIAALESEGELVRIKAEVSPILEISEITDLESKSPEGGRALFFERVEGSAFPVLTNAFGSMKRVCLAFGVDNIDELAGRLKAILNLAPPKSLGDKVKLVKDALGWSRFLPRRRSGKAPCQEIVMKAGDVDVTKLPVLQCWPKDGGRFVTLPVVHTKSLSGRKNVGMYRLQVYDRNTMGMHWHVHKDGAHFFDEYERAGRRMPLAVAIGTDPATTYAATAPMPLGIDEMLLAGFIRQKPSVMVKGMTVDIDVPAEAEIILEGYLEPGERRLEGPFGDHTGFYSLADEYPVFHVTAVTHRKGAVYSTTLVGRPPMEDCYLALVTERLFLPMLQTVLPEIVDYRLPWAGVFHNLVVAAIKKRYPGQADKVMHSIWGSGQMSFCKALFVVDDSLDLSKGRDVITTILDTVHIGRDMLLSRGILDVLDHASERPAAGGKIGIDATHAIHGERERLLIREAQSAPTAEQLLPHLGQLAGSFLECRILFPQTAHPLILLKVREGTDRDEVRRFLLSAAFMPTRCIAVLFSTTLSAPDEDLLWRASAHVDPARDLWVQGDRMVIDATEKRDMAANDRPWPEEIVMNDDIKQRVAGRLKELGLEPTAQALTLRYAKVGQ